MSDYQYLIKSEEKVIATSKAHYGWLILRLTPALVALTITGFLSFWLINQGDWGLYIFLAILLSCLILITRICIAWYHTQLIITDRRIIDVVKRGFVGVLVAESSYDSIHEIYSDKKGLADFIFKTGSLYLLVGDGKTKISIRNIPTPIRIMSLLLQLRADFLTNKENLKDINPHQMMLVLRKIKKVLGKEKFEEIINTKLNKATTDKENNV